MCVFPWPRISAASAGTAAATSGTTDAQPSARIPDLKPERRSAMLRTLLIATALLAASGTAIARSDYGHGRVVSVEPHFVLSFGTRHHDGFRVLYESGGSRYWTHTPPHPSRVLVLPPPHRGT